MEQILGGNGDMHTALSTDGRHLAHGIKSADLEQRAQISTMAGGYKR